MVSPEVQGMAALHFQNADPARALDAFLQTYNLSRSLQGSVWLIAPRSSFIKMQEEEAARRVSAENAATLLSQFFNIRYARAADIASIIQNENSNLLSDRGSVTVDARTNMLIVRDISERVTVLRRLIKQLDKPVRQILIEARLVSIDQDAEKLLGLDFSVNSHSSQREGKSSWTSSPPDTRGRYSIAVASLPDGSQLDVKLAALEQQGRAELISTPSLFTGSQQEASIESGEEVPYQEVSESGGTAITFKRAVLGLRVTPQLLPGNNVLMSLKINQDRPAARMVQGVPAISTRQIVTSVLAKSGQTVVLGGIYEIDHEHRQESIPILGNIPLIGLLFTQHNNKDRKRELLIFVTPKIMPQVI